MPQAPTSGAHGTTAGDLAANGKLFARHLRAGNRTPATIRSYLGAIEALDAYLVAQEMPRNVEAIQREHVQAFVEDHLARLKPASAANGDDFGRCRDRYVSRPKRPLFIVVVVSVIAAASSGTS